MKKLISLCIIAIFVLTMFAAQAPRRANAQSFGVAWDSSIQVLNLDSDFAANISIYYYNPDGSLATLVSPYLNPVEDTVAIGVSNTYFPIHADAGFEGSVVISSDRDIAVISNLVVNTTAKGLGSYVGFKQGDDKIFFPLLMKDNPTANTSTSMFSVQNTGDTEAAITIEFTPEVGSSYPAIADIADTLPVGAAHNYDLSQLTQFAGVTRWVGSATVSVTDTVNDSIAGVGVTVNVKFPDAFQLATYNAFIKGSTTVKLPLIQENNSGNRTSVNCQNIDPAITSNITITYVPEAGSSAKAPETKTNISPNGIAVFLQDYLGATKFVGSATVTSSPAVPMVCVVNQQKPAVGRYSAYEGFDPADASDTVVLPLIQSRNGTIPNGFVYTTINVATADGASHTVTCDYKPAPGFTDPTNDGLTGSTLVFSQADVYGTGAKFVGGAVCSTSDASSIFAIVNQTRQNPPQPTRDILSSYDGFNQ